MAGKRQAAAAGLPWQILLLAAPLLVVAAGALPALLPGASQRRPTGPSWWRWPCWQAILLGTGLHDGSPPAKPYAMLGDNQLAVLSATVQETGGQAVLDIQMAGASTADKRRQHLFPGHHRHRRGTARVVAQLNGQPLDGNPPTAGSRRIRTRYTLDLSGGQDGEDLRYYFSSMTRTQRAGPSVSCDGGIDEQAGAVC